MEKMVLFQVESGGPIYVLGDLNFSATPSTPSFFPLCPLLLPLSCSSGKENRPALSSRQQILLDTPSGKKIGN